MALGGVLLARGLGQQGQAPAQLGLEPRQAR